MTKKERGRKRREQNIYSQFIASGAIEVSNKGRMRWRNPKGEYRVIGLDTKWDLIEINGKTYEVDRIVATTFEVDGWERIMADENNEKEWKVYHKNRVMSDNRASNLMWVSAEEYDDLMRS